MMRRMWKVLLAARGLLWVVRHVRQGQHFRRSLSIGAVLAAMAPLAVHAPAEAAYLRVEEGTRGAPVRHVQELLIAAGYLEGAADGIAGPLTRAAIERCQEEHMLVVDGICGAATYLVLSGGVPYDPASLGIEEEVYAFPVSGHAPLASRGQGRSLYVSATAYSAFDPGNTNRTAMGTLLRRGVIAVDPAVIPLGTRVFIPGYGEAIAEDVGGAIRGNRIDIAFESHEEALSFGRQELEIFIME